MVTEEAPSSRPGSLAEKGCLQIVVFGVTGPICRGETETLESYICSGAELGSELDSHNAKQNSGSAWVRHPSISRNLRQRGAMTCPGSHCWGVVLLGFLAAPGPHRDGVTVSVAPPSKQ